MSEDDRESLSKVWLECSRRLTEEFSLSPSISFDELLDTERWRENVADLESLTANEASRAIIKGYVAFECFRAAFPSASICEECITDLAMEFARQILSASEEAHWTEKWRDDELAGRIRTTRFHKGSETLPNIERVSGPRAFLEVVREIIATAKSGLELGFEEYSTYLRKRVRRITAPLDSAELRIVDLLIQNRDADNLSVAKAVGISPEWASRRINELRSRWILRRFDRVPFSRIGIRMFNLFIASDMSALNLLRTLEDFPFLYSYQRVLTGSWDALAVLSVPDNSMSIRLVNSLPKILGKLGCEVLLLEIVSSGVVTCFDHYDTTEKNWFLPWELLELHLRRIYNDGLAKTIGMIDKPAERVDIKLDDLDMQIIDQMRAGNTSIARIREKLRIGQKKASDRVRRLRDAGLVDTLWEVHNIGLNEPVIVSTEDVTAGEAIAAWARRLPRAIISFNAKRHLSMMVQLPRGGSYGLTRALSFLSHQVDVGLLDEKLYGGWGFPIDLWDEKKQGWSYPKTEIDAWLASLNT
jgi:DNA-binding Lrp family transcriptional regulator